MSKQLNEKIGRRAADITVRLADAAESMGRPRPKTVPVGDWELTALPFDETVRQAADRAKDGFGTGSCRNGGDEFWFRRVNIIKFGFLSDLAAAYRATGEEAYARAARDYFEDFLEYFADGAPWDVSGVRITVRTTQWINLLPYFLDCAAFDEPLLERIVDSAVEQIRHQFDHRVGVGNVRLFQANLFLWARLRLPWLPDSSGWVQAAGDIYTDTAFRDLEADGSHSEHEPNYHGLYQGTFQKLLLWSRAFPEEDIPCFPELTARIFDYAVATHRPNGQICGLQDGGGAWPTATARHCLNAAARFAGWPGWRTRRRRSPSSFPMRGRSICATAGGTTPST